MNNRWEDFKGANVLIVGGAGFVGSALIKMLLPVIPQQILVVDNLLSSERENLPESKLVDFIQGSITKEKILKRLRDEFDYAFHLATYHGNQNSIANPLADHENNTFTTLRLYEHIKDFKRLKKVVYSSAGCTVAEKTYDTAYATTEDRPVSLYLDSPYQISKIIGELYANYYFKQHGLPVVKARFQNVYGPGEVLGAGKWRGTPATVWRNVTPTFIYRAIKGMPLIIENDGIATRDFIYIDDIVRGLLLCAVRGEAEEVYNLASGVETSIADLAKIIVELTGNAAPIELGPKRNWDSSGKRYGSTEKALKELGFRAEMSLQEGLEKTIRWTRENLAFIERCVDKHRNHMLKAD
jgi:UDP-glucose 4-epimerase